MKEKNESNKIEPPRHIEKYSYKIRICIFEWNYKCYFFIYNNFILLSNN